MKVQRNIFLRSSLCQSDISYIAPKNIEMVHHYLIISYLISMFDATGTSRTVEGNCSCTSSVFNKHKCRALIRTCYTILKTF